jgi:hypothetical protein
LTEQEGGVIVLHNGLELVIKPRIKDFNDPLKPVNREWLTEFTDELIEILKSKGCLFSLYGSKYENSIKIVRRIFLYLVNGFLN